MSLFSIKSVEGFIGESDLLNVFRGMHLKDWNRFLYGDPYISLEKVIHGPGEGSRVSGNRLVGKTDYYVAIPKKYEEILSRDAHVSKIEGDVFPKKKHYAAVCLSRSEPRLKFGELKLHEDEGVVLQVLARHLHDGPVHFESNVRVMSWADSKVRAGKILNLKKIKNRKNRRLVFDFFSRVFENNKRVRISLGDLKSFLVDKFTY